MNIQLVTFIVLLHLVCPPAIRERNRLLLEVMELDDKLPVPDVSAQKQKLTVLKDAYAAAYEDHSVTGMSALATSLRVKADGLVNDPVGRYVYLEQAHSLWAMSCNIASALETAHEISDHYLIALDRFQSDTIKYIAERAIAVGMVEPITANMLDLLERAVDSGDLAILRVASLKEVRDLVVHGSEADNARLEGVKKDTKRIEAGKNALEKLKGDSADSRASLIAGRYLCFVEGNFAEGLPLLTRSEDKILKPLAIQDKSQPTSPPELRKLGDRWKALSTSPTLDVAEQPFAALRALHWYSGALSALSGTVEGDAITEEMKKLYGTASRAVRLVEELLLIGSTWTGEYSESNGPLTVVHAKVISSSGTSAILEMSITGHAKRRYHLRYRRGTLTLERDEGIGKQSNGKPANPKDPISVSGFVNARTLTLAGDVNLTADGNTWKIPMNLSMSRD